MKTGWKLVAQLGMSGPGYPHLLVDRHGWCLRIGRGRGEEKYYSTLPSVLQGLIEHVEQQPHAAVHDQPARLRSAYSFFPLRSRRFLPPIQSCEPIVRATSSIRC